MPVPDDTPEPGLFPGVRICLFLDFDGTLVEFADQPHAVRPDAQLLPLLSSLQIGLGGAVALISGRRIDELDALLHPLRLPAAGLHGLERRDAQGRLRLEARPAGVSALGTLRPHLLALVAEHVGLLLEDKGAALAIHYRRAPQLGARVRQAVAALLASLAPQLEMLEGAMVLEIKPRSFDKASAIESFLGEAPFAGRMPVFIGDDLTDCDGFGAVRRHGGMTIAVGSRVTAQWQLPDPAAVRAWLARLADAARRQSR